MAERGVTYRIRVLADKRNTSVFKSIEKQHSAAFSRMDKRATRSGATRAKTSKKTADTEIKNGQKIVKVTDRLLGQTDKRVKRSAALRQKESKRVLISILKDQEREAKAAERKNQQIMRSRRRVTVQILREMDREARATQQQIAREEKARRRQIDKIVRGYDRVKQAALRAATGGKAAFGLKAVQQLTSYAAGFVGIHAAISKAISLFRELETERKQAAEKQRQASAGIGELVGQLAETPEQARALVAMTNRIYAAGAADSRDAAARQAFKIISAGAESQEALITEMAANRLIDQPGVMARAGRTLISSMGKKETGTFRDVFSKSLAASKFNPAEVEPLLEAAASAGVFARQLGLSDEEVLAATAVVAKSVGSAETGGQYLRFMFKMLGQVTDKQGNQKFRGMPLDQILEVVRRRTTLPGGGTDIETLKTFLGGRAGAQAAYGILGLNREEYGTVLSEVVRAQEEDVLGKRLTLAGGIPELQAAKLQRQAKAARELAELPYGVTQNVVEAIVETAQTEGMKAAAEGPDEARKLQWRNAFRRGLLTIESYMFGNEPLLRRQAIGAPGPLRGAARQRLGVRGEGELYQSLNFGLLGLEPGDVKPLPPGMDRDTAKVKDFLQRHLPFLPFLQSPSTPVVAPTPIPMDAAPVSVNRQLNVNVNLDEDTLVGGVVDEVNQQLDSREEAIIDKIKAEIESSRNSSPTTDLQPRSPVTPALSRGR